MYFIDVTKEVNLEAKYNNSKACMGIIMIDNYEEIIQRIPEDNKPQLVAQIDKVLYEWAAETGGLMIKRDRDTFIYVFEQQYLEKMEEDKFSILDKVKEIETEENMPITLSIAISNEGEAFYEKYETAHIAIDIALGRGGDQVVMKKEQK